MAQHDRVFGSEKQEQSFPPFQTITPLFDVIGTNHILPRDL
jgi:hypothetical protein